MNNELYEKNERDHIIYKPNNKNNKIGNYQIIKTMGEGTFGKVKLGIHIPTNEKVAIKILEKSKIEDNDDLKCINREISFLKTLNHINIISLYEIIENSEYYYLIMEYAENDLFSYIVENNYLSEEISSLFYYQLINAIEYIHKKKIVHRDLKPENILLTRNNLILKIIDFGLANSYKKNNTSNKNINNINNDNNDILLKTACGSPCYAAPEMVLGKKYYGLNVDIWSSGIILYAMVCGFLPFEDEDNESIYRKIILGKFDIPDKLSNSCKDLICKILEGNPKKRIKIDEIKKHPFLKNCEERFNRIISPYEIYYFYNIDSNKNVEVFNFIIDKIMNMNIKNCDNRNDIIENIKNNNFNYITSLYKILLKQAIRNKEITNNNINNIDGCCSLSSCKTSATNNIKNENFNKIKKDKNYSPENYNINNNFKYKNNINYDALDKLFKIHSFNEKKINHLKKKKINFINDKKIKNTFIKNYEDLMNNAKKLLSNRNGRNENSSSSIEINSNFNRTDGNNFKIKINNILSSSNLKVNTIRFSVDAPRVILNKENQTNECNITVKTQRKKKPLSIITSGNTFIDSYDDLIINTENNICSVNKKLPKNKLDDKNNKKVKNIISGLSSPKLFSVKTTEGNNNHSLKKNKIPKGNKYNKNVNNTNIIKSKKNLITKGTLYTKTVSVINHLNLVHNNKSKGKINNKKNLDSQKKKNYNNMMNNRFLLKTFIDTSNTNSKSPFNLKAKTKRQNIKNLTNNNTPINKNYNNFNFKEKPSPSNLDKKYLENYKNIIIKEKNKENINTGNIIFEKKRINETYKNISDIAKNEFICFTTKFTLEEVYNKIKNFFERINYSINKKDKTHFDILNKNKHFISIQISKFEKNSIVNIYKITNNKNQSKNIIKNLITEIGF